MDRIEVCEAMSRRRIVEDDDEGVIESMDVDVPPTALVAASVSGQPTAAPVARVSRSSVADDMDEYDLQNELDSSSEEAEEDQSAEYSDDDSVSVKVAMPKPPPKKKLVRKMARKINL